MSRFITNVATDWSHGATVSNIDETKELVVSSNRDVAAKRLQILKTQSNGMYGHCFVLRF